MCKGPGGAGMKREVRRRTGMTPPREALPGGAHEGGLGRNPGLCPAHGPLLSLLRPLPAPVWVPVTHSTRHP